MGGALIWTSTQNPIYETSAQLSFEIQDPSTKLQSNSPVLIEGTSAPHIETHINQLKSDQHLKKTAHQIAVSNIHGYQSFVSRTAGPPLEQISWIESVRGHIRKLKKILYRSLPFLSSNPPQEPPKEIAQGSAEERFTVWLKEHVHIESAKNPSAITITAWAETPVFAAQIANSVATVYLYQIRPSVTQPAQSYVAWLNSQGIEPKLQKILNQAKGDHQAISSTHTNSNKENQSQGDLQTLTPELHLEKELFKAGELLVRYQLQQDAISKIREDLASHNPNQWMALSTFQQLPTILDFPKIQWIYAKRQEWLATINRTRKKTTPNQLKVKTGQRQIAGLSLLLKKEIDHAYQVGTSQLNTARFNANQARQAIPKIKKSQRKTSQFNRMLNGLKTESYQQAPLYTAKIKTKEFNPMTPSHRFETVHFSRPALPQYSAISPQPILTALWGLLIGLGGGIGMAIFLENIPRKTRHLQDPEDLNNIKPGLHFFGRMPKAGFSKEEPFSPYFSETDDSEFFNEHIQHITESIQAFSSHEDSREWLITSPRNHEGKTLLAHNIAKVLVQQACQPVLLIDANIALPTIHQMLALHKKPSQAEGLSDFLFNKAELNTIVQTTHIPNLHVISTGTWSTLSPELFQSTRFHNLLQWCKVAKFHVIFIGPPVFPGTDIRYIANQIEETIMVVQPEKTSREEIKNAIHHLDNHGATLSGIVFHQFVSEKKMRETESVRFQKSQPAPPLSWKRTHGLPPSKHPPSSQTGTPQKLAPGRQEVPKPILVDYQREVDRLKFQLKALRNERDILANTARFFSKFARASPKIPALKWEKELPTTPKPISRPQNYFP